MKVSLASPGKRCGECAETALFSQLCQSLTDCLARACSVYDPDNLTRPLTYIEFKQLLNCLGWTEERFVDAYYNEDSVVSPHGWDLRCGLHGCT